MAPKSQESQLWEFQDSHLGVLGQNAIWMWALWKGIEYTIREKVVASPQVRALVNLVNSTLLMARFSTKVLQLCTNQLVVWFCAGPCEWLSAYHSSYSHPGAPTRPFTPKCFKPRNMSPTPYFFVVFILKSHLSLSRSLGAHQWPFFVGPRNKK